MRVRTLIATADTAYTGHISDYISEHHADTVEISVCNTAGQLSDMLGARRYDVALMDAALLKHADLSAVNLPMLLWPDGRAGDEDAAAGGEGGTGVPPEVKRVKKHRRISSTIAEILEQYAAVTGNMHISGEIGGSITAVWSPCGGVGKTTVALAYAASKAAREKDVFYLNLEHFATTPAYFAGHGKSISSVFEMLEGGDGNVKMLVSGIRGCEGGIKYLCAPENFDDVCILTPENIRELVTCCAGTANELVIDLSCACDTRTRQVFELADKVLLVSDRSETAKTKLAQFVSQSDVFERLKGKVAFVVNRNRDMSDTVKDVGLPDFIPKQVVMLPYIQEADEGYVYRALAKGFFQ